MCCCRRARGERDLPSQNRFFADSKGAVVMSLCALNRLELSSNKQSHCHKLPHASRRLEACLVRPGSD